MVQGAESEKRRWGRGEAEAPYALLYLGTGMGFSKENHPIRLSRVKCKRHLKFPFSSISDMFGESASVFAPLLRPLRSVLLEVAWL